MAQSQIMPTPGADRLKVKDQRKLLEQKSLLKEARFRNVGPAIMSGRVVDIEANPQDPTEFYIAYASGGLWYTTNNGQSFDPIFDSEEVITIGDIAVVWDGSPAASRTIWLGSGEVNSSRSSYAGMGVYKTTNNGKSWEYLGLPESHHIGKIQLHPTDKNTAWVAVLGHLYSPNKERGVFKTTDGGKTWRQTLFIDNNTGVVEMDINPSNPNELYAAAWYRTRSAWNFEEGNKSSAIYKSTDGGETWQSLTGDGKSGFPAGEGVGRIGLCVYPKNPQIVYAVVDNNFHKPDTARRDTSRYELKQFEKITKEAFARLDDKKLEAFLRRSRMPAKYTAASVKDLVKTDKVKPTALYDYLFDANTALFTTPIIGCEVYRSNDGGKSWKKTHEKDISIFNTYGYYFAKIYVSPYNEDKLYNLGFSAQLSTDGGKTWKTIDKGNVHADHHALWIDPKRDSHIIDGNDGGANISYDNGDHWFKANTPPVGQFYAITVDFQKPYNVYGGLQDNGSWMGPSNHLEDIGWIDNGVYPYKSIGGGDGMQVQVDTNGNTIYAGFQFGAYFRRSLHGGSPSRSVKPVRDLGEAPLRFNWQTPILLSKHNQDVFYIGSNRFHRSLNRGDVVEALSGDLTNGEKEGDVPYGTLTTMDESPLKFGLLYAGSDDGNLHVSKDGGYTWTNISKKLPQGLWVSRVVASKYKEGRVYVTLNGYRFDHFLPYLFVSDDFGMNWKALGKDLPFEPLNVVREDPQYDSVLYVGSDGGLYVSIDAGNSFSMWNNGLPESIPIHDIAIQPRENEIVLGTHGRSLYIAKLDSVHLLLKDISYREKKQAGADRAVAAMQGISFNELFNREGIEVECPPIGGDVQKVDKRRKKAAAAKY